MKEFEFVQTVKTMRSSFERVNSWLEKAEKEGRYEMVIASWKKIFLEVSQEGALRAIDQLLIDENKPRSAEDYALRIRRIVKEGYGVQTRPKEDPLPIRPTPPGFLERMEGVQVRYADRYQRARWSGADLMMWPIFAKCFQHGYQDWMEAELARFECVSEQKQLAEQVEECPF